MIFQYRFLLSDRTPPLDMVDIKNLHSKPSFVTETDCNHKRERLLTVKYLKLVSLCILLRSCIIIGSCFDAFLSQVFTTPSKLSLQVGRNICHGSDAVDSAQKEIALWFKEEDLVSWKPAAVDWIYE